MREEEDGSAESKKEIKVLSWDARLMKNEDNFVSQEEIEEVQKLLSQCHNDPNMVIVSAPHIDLVYYWLHHYHELYEEQIGMD